MKYNEIVRLVNQILEQYQEATIRQIYYRLVSPPYQYMENNRSMYCSFDKKLTQARERGDVDWRKIVDHTRSAIVPRAPSPDTSAFMDSLKNVLRSHHENYHVDKWDRQRYKVTVFVEKDALARIVSEVATPYQVPVIPGRGFNSFTQLMGQAETFENVDKTIILLYFGDFDPSGLDIDRSALERLKQYCPGADIHMLRRALTEDDISSLPPNPTKASDSRAPKYVAKYGNQCWELDALPPDQLRARVLNSITELIDLSKWDEDTERETTDRIELQREIEAMLGVK